MIRLKITRTGKYKAGEIVTVSKNEAFGLIDRGEAIVTKDMTSQDYKVTKKVTNGHTT